ncbi:MULTISPECIES: GntR family transcriptional regulator [unclassified Leclercia]|uniref:GntR family transcriptional regulator n=1 Tax=Leclercia barmai TaxID=2785629 RepID=A0ABS7RXG7_9ENTR|nr:MULTISPECIES: GntR family transcriptional regulator [unclassified Leclercia]MBZ0058980.1 GntR family transcriptional regulator [Leclercia sp. EMC7]MCM5697016.1 GntR family transcriptional regulator [Leclercia sp. LTM01]MCM5701154.1 GntR family transcriptional regulator [Leclercia sp. LTM14]
MSDVNSSQNNEPHSLKYLDLFTLIKNKIDAGEWAENATIPTERELAERYKTSRTTVRKAIEHLRQKGYLHSEHGRGTFVLPELSRRSQRQLHGFTDDILARNGVPRQQILEFGFVPANEMLRHALQLSGNRPVLRIKRLRFDNTTPMGIQTAWLPVDEAHAFTQEELLEAGSLYKLLAQKMGLELLEAYETIGARQPSAAEASLLELSVNDVILTCSRVTLSVNRKPMEYVEMIYPASRYAYEIKITKDSFSRK